MKFLKTHNGLSYYTCITDMTICGTRKLSGYVDSHVRLFKPKNQVAKATKQRHTRTHDELVDPRLASYRDPSKPRS